MDNLVLFSNKERTKLIKKRSKEAKLGELITVPEDNLTKSLSNPNVKFVLFGVNENIGNLANCNQVVYKNIFKKTLKTLLNTQANKFIKPEELLILGYLDFSLLEQGLYDLDADKKSTKNKAKTLVETIDKSVSHTIFQIIAAGKIPIIIGNGHNNAYGNIKGSALALQKPINAINFSAKSNYHVLKGRHSNNGISYAYNEGFLKKYFLFGIHENETPQVVFDTIDNAKHIKYNTYENISINKTTSFNKTLKSAQEFIESNAYGIEFNCNAILDNTIGFNSGFTIEKARQFIHNISIHDNASYLHICDSSTVKKKEKQRGMLTSYFILDFIKAKTTLLTDD